MLTSVQKEKLGPIFTIANFIRLKILRIVLAGKNVWCPCCKTSFRKFAAFGNPRRQNAWCPKCQSLERHRLLWMFLEKETDLYKKPVKMLHVAPEEAFFKLFKGSSNIDYHPVDIFPHLYPKGTTYFNLLENDSPDNIYNVIICNHVFQYIEDDHTAMSEVFRLLNPGGWAILQVPLNKSLGKTFEDKSIIDPKERERLFGLKEHTRFYSSDYKNRLENVGFTVNAIDYTSKFTEDEIRKFGFYQGDDIYLGVKK